MPKSNRPKGYTIKMQAAGDTAEVYIYDEIGPYNCWFDTVDAKSFVQEFDAIDTPNINVRINSPGGDVFDGVAIANSIRRHDANVTVYVDGLAASIASIIALAGDEVVMGIGSQMMIHEPWTGMLGGSDDFRKAADLLDQTRDDLVGIYTKKSGKTYGDVVDAMKAETWLTAQDAVDFGLADRVDEDNEVDLKIVANVDYRIAAKWRNAPAAVRAAARRTDPRMRNAMEPDEGDEATFNCPACGEPLVVETQAEDESEDTGSGYNKTPRRTNDGGNTGNRIALGARLDPEHALALAELLTE